MNKIYTIKNPENLYHKEFTSINHTETYEDTPEEYLEAIRNKNICQYAVKTIKAGDWLECCLYPTWLKQKDVPRTDKGKATTPTQESLNERNAVKQLERLINANFKPNHDYVITANADNKHLYKTTKEARAAATKAINRLKYRFQSQNKAIKYIYVIEYKNAKSSSKHYIVQDGVQMIRVHIHMIVSAGLTYKEMRSFWKLGHTVHIEPLRDYKDGYRGLAKYLTKEAKNGHRRWSTSHNLKKPKETIAYRKSYAKKSKVREIATKEYLRKQYFEKIYSGYEFIECEEPKFNNINDGVYIYARLRKK